MTMFTEGRLQAYERMMQQPYSHSRDRRDERPLKHSAKKKAALKGGEANGSHTNHKK